jgi:hypothetical protein
MESVEVGNCLACNDDESLVEMMIYRTFVQDRQHEPPLSWELRTVADNDLIFSGVSERNETNVWENYASLLFQNVRQCVPSHECFRFFISIPQDYDLDDEDFVDQSEDPYTLKLDGVFYRSGENGLYWPIHDNETIYLGDCSAALLCNETEANSSCFTTVTPNKSFREETGFICGSLNTARRLTQLSTAKNYLIATKPTLLMLQCNVYQSSTVFDLIL